MLLVVLAAAAGGFPGDVLELVGLLILLLAVTRAASAAGLWFGVKKLLARGGDGPTRTHEEGIKEWTTC